MTLVPATLRAAKSPKQVAIVPVFNFQDFEFLDRCQKVPKGGRWNVPPRWIIEELAVHAGQVWERTPHVPRAVLKAPHKIAAPHHQTFYMILYPGTPHDVMEAGLGVIVLEINSPEEVRGGDAGECLATQAEILACGLVCASGDHVPELFREELVTPDQWELQQVM